MKPLPIRRPLARRAILAGGLACFLPLDWSLAATPPERLEFIALRNGRKIGEQQMTFGTGDGITAHTQVELSVKLGPIALYHYRHEATERWNGDRFIDLKTQTNDNGKMLRVEARREGGKVTISPAAGGALEMAADALPFTHWNRRIGSTPLFNPQDGKILRETVSKVAGRAIPMADGSSQPAASGLVFHGDAEITDWYDEAGVWMGLQGRLKDGSMLEYRRV